MLACRPMRIAGAYALVAAILAAVFAVGILAGGYRAVERSDYMTYHVAARIVLDGDAACLYEVECQAEEQFELIGEEPSFVRGALPFNSPPWLAALVAPLGLLPLQLGFALFTLAGVVILAFGAWAVAGWSGATVPQRTLATVFLLTAWPTVMGAIRGQSTLMVTGLLAMSIGGSGVALGLSALKPTLLPLWVAWLLLARRWRQLLVAAGVLAALVLISLLVVSPQALADYPAHLLGVAAPDAIGVHPEEMINWRGVAARLQLGDWLPWLGTALTLALVALAWWRNRSRAFAAGVAFLATPLVIPHANQHEAILAGLGVLLVIAAFPAHRPLLAAGAIATHAVLWAGPVLAAQSAEVSAWLLFGTVLAWLLTAAWQGMRVAINAPRDAGT